MAPRLDTSAAPYCEPSRFGDYNEETIAETGIQSIDVQQDRLVGLSMHDLEYMQRLADTVLAVVKVWIDAEKIHVLEIVRSRPVAKVLAAGMKPRRPAGIESVNKARKKG